MRAKTYPRNSNWLNAILIGSYATVMLTMACSLLNREGPNVTCTDLDNGAQNACSNGIIATCSAGKMTYQVCDLDTTCEQTWQTQGQYRCDQNSPVPNLTGSGGTGSQATGTGGTSGGASACGFTFATTSCASCVETNCCVLAITCSQAADCASCITRTGADSPCAPGMVGSYDNITNCLNSSCVNACQ